MTKRGTITSLLAAGCLLVSPVLTYAESTAEQLQQVESQLTGKQQEIQQQQQAKLQLEQGMAQLQLKIDDLTTSIVKNNEDLARIQKQREQLEQEIAKKEQRAAELQTIIAARQDVIDKRLLALQAQPHTSLITEVLLHSRNLVEMLENFYSIQLILDSDNAILQEQLTDKKLLKQEQEAIQDRQRQVKKQEEQETRKREELAANEQNMRVLLQDMHTKLVQTTEELESAEEAAALLQAQQTALKKAIVMEEAEKAAVLNQTAPAVNAGGFIKPAAGAYSSSFGMREGGMHYGIDIAAPGDVPVFAAAAGVVIRSYYSATYGNVVFVSHRINGQTFTTVYAHLKSMGVTTGQSVSQGQQLGIMGNTGASRGQHLHFELHAGEWNLAKSNAVDPRPYLQ